MPSPPEAIKLAGWPFSTEQALSMQKAAGPTEKELDLGEGVGRTFVAVGILAPDTMGVGSVVGPERRQPDGQHGRHQQTRRKPTPRHAPVSRPSDSRRNRPDG